MGTLRRSPCWSGDVTIMLTLGRGTSHSESSHQVYVIFAVDYCVARRHGSVLGRFGCSINYYTLYFTRRIRWWTAVRNRFCGVLSDFLSLGSRHNQDAAHTRARTHTRTHTHTYTHKPPTPPRLHVCPVRREICHTTSGGAIALGSV